MASRVMFWRVLVLATVLTLPSWAQSEPSSEPASGITWIEITDRRGRPVRRVAPEDLSILVDGMERPALSAAPAGAGAWRTVIYVDSSLSSPVTVGRAGELLGQRLAGMLELGTVEIWAADPEARLVLPATREEAALAEGLGGLALRDRAQDEIGLVRQAFLSRASEVSGPGRDIAAAEALSQEVDARQRQQDELLWWLDSQGRSQGPRLLVILSDALGSDPAAFYQPEIQDDPGLAVSAALAPDPKEVARSLGAYGWTAAVLALGGLSERESAVDYAPTEDMPVGFRIRLGGGDRNQEEDEEDEPLTGLVWADRSTNGEVLFGEGPQERSRSFAAASGGFVVSDLKSLDDLLDRAPRVTEISYSLPRGVAPVRIRSAREEWRARTPTGLLSGTPQEVSAAIVRRFLAGADEPGPVSVLARLIGDPAREVRLDVAGEPETEVASRELRVTVGAHRESGGPPLIRHEVVSNPDWQYDGVFRLPEDADAVAVVLEDLDSGLRGASFAELADYDTRDVSGDPLRIVPLGDKNLRGTLRVRVDVDETRVGRVVYLLDGEVADERDKAPFDGRVRLGFRVRTRELTALAYDRDGRELARDTVILNAEPSAFWVRIAEPRTRRRTGPVSVEAEIHAPAGAEVDRVEFYWNDRLTAVAWEPPYRKEIRIPLANPVGYIRVNAYLADGRTAEQALLMNSSEFVGEIAVELVELYAVVTDRRGRPVQGLVKEDFRVQENGDDQEIASFRDASDLPLTVGMAIDASASMFVKLPDVQVAAEDFVTSLADGRDRAFLMGFGTEPRVITPLTRDLDRLDNGIGSLEASGETALWESIVESLKQLEDVAGRKALVVFYDGADEDDESFYRRSVELAEETGTPVYLIIMNDEAARTEGRDFRTRGFASRLNRLAAAGGGRVHFVRTGMNLAPIFQEIGEELRSHYLLTFYSERPFRGREWRHLEVDVKRKGLTTRTLSGFYSQAEDEIR